MEQRAQICRNCILWKASIERPCYRFVCSVLRRLLSSTYRKHAQKTNLNMANGIEREHKKEFSFLLYGRGAENADTLVF